MAPVAGDDVRTVTVTAASLYRISDFNTKKIADIIQGQMSEHQAVDGAAVLDALLAAMPPSESRDSRRALLSKQLQLGAINKAVAYIKHEFQTLSKRGGRCFAYSQAVILQVTWAPTCRRIKR